jgi:hypothetical protein
MSVDFRRRTIKVQGTDVLLDTAGDLPIADLSNDMDRVASQMAWWASVWSAAEKERIQAEAHYRAWRGRLTLDILAANEKEAEWKVKAKIEADPKFLQYKDAMAMSEENAVLAKGIFESFQRKGNMLQSRGAMVRGEMGAGGMATRSESAPSRRADVSTDEDDAPDGAGAPGVEDPRVTRMRENNKKSKKKEKVT